MSKFIFHRNSEDTLNNQKIQTESFLRDGAKGLTFKFMTLNKKKKIYKKINGRLKDDGKTVNIKVKEEGKGEKEEDIKVGDLKKHKELKFVIDYIAKDMLKFRKSITQGGKKRRSSRKKVSRKKVSRKKVSRKKVSKKKTSRKR